MGRDPSQSAMCLWSEIALQDNEEKGVSSFSADALPWTRPCDTADKYAGDRGTEGL